MLLLPIVAFGAGTAQRELSATLRSKADAVHGAQLFSQCASCHSVHGGGETNGSTPRIAGQHCRVLAKQLVDFRYSKRWDSRMESMADRHHLDGPQNIADVADYVTGLSRPGERGLASRALGNSNAKDEPLPSVELTSIRKSSRRAMRCTMLRPSP
jgi:cytochrome c553